MFVSRGFRAGLTVVLALAAVCTVATAHAFPNAKKYNFVVKNGGPHGTVPSTLRRVVIEGTKIYCCEHNRTANTHVISDLLYGYGVSLETGVNRIRVTATWKKKKITQSFSAAKKGRSVEITVKVKNNQPYFEVKDHGA